MALPFILQYRHQALLARLGSSDIQVIRPSFLERQPDKFAASLYAWPVKQFISHGDCLPVKQGMPRCMPAKLIQDNFYC
jgi:hypothetical protein